MWIYVSDFYFVFLRSLVFLPEGRDMAGTMCALNAARARVVEIVEQGGDAGGLGLVHDRPRAAGGGGRLSRLRMRLLTRGMFARRHRQVAQAEAEQQRGKTRFAGPFRRRC